MYVSEWMVWQGCEREVAEAQKGSSDELFKECLMRLSWSLVHSRHPEDVLRGIAMLEGSLLLWSCQVSVVYLISWLWQCISLLLLSLGLFCFIVLTWYWWFAASVSDANSSALQLRETLYLLAVGYYRSGDYSKSRELVEQCLMVWYLVSWFHYVNKPHNAWHCTLKSLALHMRDGSIFKNINT